MLTFFWKIFNFFSAAWKSSLFIPIRYISKFLKISTAFCVFFLRKIYRYTYRITDLELFFGHFKLKSNPPKGGLHSPTTEVIFKTPPVALLLLEKNQKNFSSPLIIKITPLFCNTLFELFFKNFYPYTVDYHFFLAFCITPTAFFLKKSPSNGDYRIFFAFCFCLLEKVKFFPPHRWLSQ